MFIFIPKQNAKKNWPLLSSTVEARVKKRFYIRINSYYTTFKLLKE